MLKIKVLFLWLFVVLCINFCFAQETLTITTYYPSPYGVYNELRLYPHSPPTVTCSSSEEGLMYYDSGTANLNVCRFNGTTYAWESIVVGVGGGGGQWWTASGTNIYNTNTGNVGIGTTGPGVKLSIQGVSGAPATSGTAQNGSLRLQGVLGAVNEVIDMGVVGGYTWIQATDQSDLSQGYILSLNPEGGNVGIGTTGPAIHLAIGDTDTGLQQQGDGELALYTDNSERVRIDNAGNVGIGTTGPGEKLDIDLGNLLVQGTGSFDAEGEEAIVYLGDTPDTANYIKSVIYPGGRPMEIGVYNSSQGKKQRLIYLSAPVGGPPTAGSITLEGPTTVADNPLAIFGGDLILLPTGAKGTQWGIIKRTAGSPGNLHIDSYYNSGDTGGNTYINWFSGKEVNIGNGAQDWGTIRAATYAPPTSRIFKKDIQPLTSEEYNAMLSKLEKLEVVRYRYKDAPEGSKLRLGVIAEDSPEEILADDRKSMSLSDAVGFLLATAKAQQQEIRVLEAEIGKLNHRVEISGN